jgi:hypothetical protein
MKEQEKRSCGHDLSLPTATGREHKIGIFQPTRRPELINTEITTKWGKIRIKARLGQQHADVFEAICHEFEARTPLECEMEDGRIKLLVDPAKIKRKSRQKDLKNILTDLRAAVIEIIEPPNLQCMGGLIDYIDFARKPDGSYITKRNPLGGERRMWRVDLGKAFCKLIQKDIWINYDPKPIAELRHGITQAAVRFILSHSRNSGPKINKWKIDTVITAVSGDISSQELRDRRREILKDKENLNNMGIKIENGYIFTTNKKESVEHLVDIKGGRGAFGR